VLAQSQYVFQDLSAPALMRTHTNPHQKAEDVEHNSLYIAEVGIGTPPQTVKLNLDTGSADTWV